MAEVLGAPRGKWATRRDLATALGKRLLEDERVPQPLKDRMLEHRQVALDVMEDAIMGFGLSYEFRILRLTEQLKDAIKSGAFGPLVVPNTVDQQGQPIFTPVGEIAMLFKDIYSPEFLELFDEEGNPIG